MEEEWHGNRNSVPALIGVNQQSNGKQLVKERYEAVSIAIEIGLAVDSFTMIYPKGGGEKDPTAIDKPVEFIAAKKVNGYDVKGRELRNQIDAPNMSPCWGTKVLR